MNIKSLFPLVILTVAMLIVGGIGLMTQTVVIRNRDALIAHQNEALENSTAALQRLMKATSGSKTAMDNGMKTILMQQQRIEELKQIIADYHRRLTGEPHPFYEEEIK